MKPSTGWRNLCIFLALVCTWQAWRGCHRDVAPPTAAACAQARAKELATTTPSATPPSAPASSEGPTATAAEASDGGATFYGFKIPGWAMWLAPHPGENMRAYRDRMLPIAQSAIAPHRARVARSRDDFAAAAGLDDRQRAELEAATKETASALQERVMGALLDGEFSPSTFKPMVAVGLAKELIDIVDKGNQRFTSSLRTDQRAALSRHPFDFGDYLVFSTKWEDALAFFD